MLKICPQTTMEQPMYTKIENLSQNPNAQLYLRAYEDQQRRHQRFRYMYSALAILAAFVPPVSLIFTVKSTLIEQKTKSSIDLKAIGYCTLFALFPFASGLLSWSLIDNFEEERRKKDKVQKLSYCTQDFTEEKNYLKETKNRMRNMLHIEIKKPSDKPKKIEIHYQDNNKSHAKDRVDVYLDREQMARRKHCLNYGVSLFWAEKHGQAHHIRQDDITKLSLFFQNTHAESIKIVEELKSQYQI